MHIEVKNMVIWVRSRIGFLLLGLAIISSASCGERSEAVHRNSLDVEKSTDENKQNEPIRNAGIYIFLTSQKSNAEDELATATLSIRRGKRASMGPRVMDVYLRLSGNLEYVSSEKGRALIDSSKELVVQRKGENMLRLVSYSSTSINELRSGVLAHLVFRKTDDMRAQVEILTDAPIFAPAQANEGLLVGEPIVFE